MKVQWLGVGDQFTLKDWQSNAIITASSGKKLLIDCGQDIRKSMAEAGFKFSDIDAVYVSHAHADHCGGIETLAFAAQFDPNRKTKIKFYANAQLLPDLWAHTLSGGLLSLEGEEMTITRYCECHPIPINGSDTWEDLRLVPLRVHHVRNGLDDMPCFGLFVIPKAQTTIIPKDWIEHKSFFSFKSPVACRFCGSAIFPDKTICPKCNTAYPPAQSGQKCVLFTTDTRADIDETVYDMADEVFHDCETGYPSHVHSHYNELLKKSAKTRKKLHLVHSQDDHAQDAIADGFAGFVKRGEVFEF